MDPPLQSVLRLWSRVLLESEYTQAIHGSVRTEGAQGWNDGREAVKRQAYRLFNGTRVEE